jgi:hypothetical protein
LKCVIQFGPQAGREPVAAAAEGGANLLHIDQAARTEARPGEAVGHGFEDKGDLHRADGLEIFDEALGLVGRGAGAGVDVGPEIKPGDAFALGEMKGVEHLAQEQEALGAETLVATLGQRGRIGPGLDQTGGDFEGAGGRLPVPEAAGVGHEADVEIGGGLGGKGPLERGDDFVKDLRGGRRFRVDEVKLRSVAGIADVVVDVDVGSAPPRFEGRPEPFRVGAIDGDDEALGLRRRHRRGDEKIAAGEKSEGGSDAVGIDREDVAALRTQAQRETEGRAVGIAVRAEVGDDQDVLVPGADVLEGGERIGERHHGNLHE